MKIATRIASFLVALLVPVVAVAQTLPVITSSPTTITNYPGNTATFTVTATGATGYQWLFQGTNIPGATGSTLQIANAQSGNCGYYMAIVKNSIGWTPSQMAYLFLDYTYGGSQPTADGVLPLSNSNNIYFQGDVENAYSIGGGTPNNGTVQIVAGPELDEMQLIRPIVPYRPPFSLLSWFSNGYYNATSLRVSTIRPGQTFYYGVVVNYTNGGPYFQPSTILRLVAGTNGSPAPSCYGLKFPTWWAAEGVEPEIYSATGQTTYQLRVAGENCSFSYDYFAYNDYGTPTNQWRKNGVPIPNATNTSIAQSSFTITNVQASDAGIYDLIVYGNEWVVSPKITLSVQITNGAGVFQGPNFVGTNFVCGLVGAAGRNYQVESSTNLANWSNLTTLSNLSGTVMFTNPAPSSGAQFYRTMLLP